MMTNGRRCLVALGLVLAAVLGTASPAGAQYFGRNQVQYRDFDFRVLKTEHFDIYFYPTEREAAQFVGQMAERWYARLSTYFEHELSGRQPLIIYATQAQFQQTNAVGGAIGEGTGGVTEALLRRIVMPVGGPLRETEHVLGHELVHAFQYDITGRPGSTIRGGFPGAAALPLWFIEGMAEYLSLGPRYAHTAMWIRDASQDELPAVSDLTNPEFFPYRFGHALLAYIAGRWGDEAIPVLLKSAARRQDVGVAIEEVLRVTPERLSELWHQEIHAAYDPLVPQTQAVESVAHPIVTPEEDERRYNVSPAVSPDGSLMAYLSDRGLFSIDLFLADARTGEVLDQITETALDPHFQSLQFLNSAGGWSADGTRLAFAGLSGGYPVLAIYDIERRDVVREVKLDSLGEIYSPTWSPDGRYIAFSGVAGGLSDLYLYDLEQDTLIQLTDDVYADLQPSWSPDGRNIALSTDRFSTSLGTLEIGNYRLALYDVATRELRPIGPRVDGKQINPQWSPDSRSLYYLSDRTGITNVYRLDLADGRTEQVTNLFTGASGITDVGPALSVATGTGEIVFSVFGNGGYGIFRIDDVQALVASSSPAPPPDPSPAMLPPQDRAPDGIVALLNDATTGLPDTTAFAVQPYNASLKLIYVGQPTLTAGTDRFGTFVGGGAALYFSDLLGDHNLVTALQVGGTLENVTALVGYSNLGNRLNWGVSALQLPFVTGAFGSGFDQRNGQQVFVEQELINRQTNREITAQVSYPFSQVQRVDLAAGFTNITFDRELRTRVFDPVTGQFLGEEEEDLETFDALNLGQASAALVYDNSIFGATSPIIGQRYRFEVAPYFGDLNLVNGLADFRRYFMPVRPFTFAVRLMHFGRYGSDAEDERLTPLFLGYDGLVRGYSFGSFDASECDPPPGDPDACPVFDQLLGSRILVGNAELRFPLFGVLDIGGGYYGALPIELALFADAGVAWTEDLDPSFLDGSRDIVSSAGIAARLNLLGFAVVEIAYVRPFDRPERSSVWQFSLQPGF